MLVTTVVALGWIAKDESMDIPPCARNLVIGLFGGSIAFAIFTLALVPLVVENIGIQPPTNSIYDIKPKFKLIWMRPRPEIGLRLKTVCWPQHVLFLAGIAVFTYANIFW
jgi:hypothetical protein